MIEKSIVNKQFLISAKELEESIEISQNVNRVKMQKGFYLYCGDGLDIVLNADNSCAIIGDAWQVYPEGNSPQELIEQINENTSDDEVYEIEYTWAGRYVLVVGDRLYTDSFGHRGVFYGNGCVSSSLTVLCELFDISLVYPKLKKGVTVLDNMPGEDTMYEQFKRLLPSQVLNIATLKWHHRPLLPYGIENYSDEIARTEAFKKYFECGLLNMRKTLNGRFVFALTGGADCRTTYALMNDAGIDIDTFTLQFDNMDPGDKQIPAKLAELCGKSYQIISGGVLG